ncbi:MAG: glycosyltransferase family 4 protein [Muribaculaceae bacterium]|nr:glycosyltransferase family 4 protein [Muribaculaceae bacterium]
MKIVHICDCLRGGGIQNFLLSLLPEQVSQGHDVTLIVVERYDYDYCQHLDNVMTSRNVKVICLGKTKNNKLSLLKTIFKCRRIIAEIAPDIINTHASMSHTYGCYSVVGQNMKHVLTIHNAPEIWPTYLHFLCHDKPLIFCSQAAYNMRKQNSPLMVSIDNGISRDIVHSSDVVDLRDELNLKSTDKIIVSVGSLRPQKNYTFIKKIVDEMNDSTLHFCICGGNYGNGYISMEEFCDYPNIHCLGLRSDVSAIENGADLFLSCATFEGLPIAVLEAYFNGIPCVLSPIPQHRNIGGVESVWIPEKFEAHSFADTIKEALKNDVSHDLIYEQRKSQIEKYSIAETAIQYISFYNKVLESCC